jgi:hypothetical protein
MTFLIMTFEQSSFVPMYKIPYPGMKITSKQETDLKAHFSVPGGSLNLDEFRPLFDDHVVVVVRDR